jgi:hypothetical protein
MSLNFSDVASQSCIHKVLLYAIKFCDMWPVTSHPKEGVLGFLLPLKISHLGSVWSHVPWVQWQAH